jgi:DNA polymerase-3 subunit chi
VQSIAIDFSVSCNRQKKPPFGGFFFASATALLLKNTMPTLSFYHLTTTPLATALPQLVEKALGTGRRVLILTGSQARTEALDDLLWTYNPNSFLPHGTARDGNAALQPVWLTDADENPNNAQILFLVDHARSPLVATMERCLVVFDGRDDAAVAQARMAWKDYKALGYALTYFKQDEEGRWRSQ